MRTLAKILAAITAALALYVWITHRIAAGLIRVERVPLGDSPADYGRHYETVRFRARGNDVTLEGWYLPGRRGLPVVILVHGISSNRTTGGMTELASMLNADGFGALLFDLRGQGRSGGKHISGGWHERMDVLGAFDYLTARGVPPQDIGLLGWSLGASACALAAAEEPRIRALVLDSPFARAADIMDGEVARRTPLPAWAARIFRPAAALLASRLYDIDLYAIAPEGAVAKLDYPICVITATDDERIPTDHARRVHAAAPAGSRLWEVPEIPHCAAFWELKDEYAKRVGQYFLKSLSHRQSLPPLTGEG